MTQFFNIWGASPVNNQIGFFDGHDSHFDERVLIHMECQKIQPFVLKLGDSKNDQPNDNGPNEKLKSLYNDVNAARILNNGTSEFLTHCMNSILVEAW